jgi:hypothetical protein
MLLELMGETAVSRVVARWRVAEGRDVTSSECGVASDKLSPHHKLQHLAIHLHTTLRPTRRIVDFLRANTRVWYLSSACRWVTERQVRSITYLVPTML